MRRFLLITSGLFLGALSGVNAQTAVFVTQTDTAIAMASTSGSITIPNHITEKTGDSIRIQWHVIASDFPTDWSAGNLGICDNNTCYTNGTSALWNGTTGTTFTSGYYKLNVTGDYHMVIDLSSATTMGTHYMTAKLVEPVSGYTKNVTFLITRWPAGVTSITKSEDDITLYPNPARNQLNVVFNPDIDIKTIAVYNLIGRVVNVYKVSGSSAGMDISNLPSGIYFLRLVDSQGNVVATRKFTHQ